MPRAVDRDFAQRRRRVERSGQRERRSKPQIVGRRVQDLGWQTVTGAIIEEPSFRISPKGVPV